MRRLCSPLTTDPAEAEAAAVSPGSSAGRGSSPVAGQDDDDDDDETLGCCIGVGIANAALTRSYSPRTRSLSLPLHALSVSALASDVRVTHVLLTIVKDSLAAWKCSPSATLSSPFRLIFNL